MMYISYTKNSCILYKEKSQVFKRRVTMYMCCCRKMYNEALMVRKVKSYLSSINITTDEEILQRISLEIEPPQVTISQSHLREIA